MSEGILPMALELTPGTKLRAALPPLLASSEPDHSLYYLNALSEPWKNWLRNDPEGENITDILREESEKFIEEHNLDEETCDAANYAFYKRCLQALRDHGLDFKGGLHRLLEADQIAYEEVSHLSLLSILVIDPDKAKKVVDLGLKLNTAVPKYPTSLEEASTMYAKLDRLVNNSYTVKEIDKKIDKEENEYEIWEWRREKFRIQTRDRYREMLINLAREDWLDDQVRPSHINQLRTILT